KRHASALRMVERTLAIAMPLEPTPSLDWRDRFRAPNRRFLAWAAERPERRLLLSNESGRYLIDAWEPETAPRPLPEAAKAGYTWLSPNGETVVYVEARHDCEVGRLMRVGWAGGQPEAAAPELPPLYVYGLQVGRDGALYFAGAGEGRFRIYRRDATPEGAPARALYEHANEAYLPYLSADEQLLPFCTSEP